jgi:putative CocE/NonD family hydrolase
MPKRFLLVWLASAAAGLSQAPWHNRLIHNFGYVPLKDGTEISYTLFRPAAQGRFPTLLLYNMYDASASTPYWDQTESTEIADYLERGYAVMGANMRGTACSSGEQDILNAERVGRDGAEVVEWIAAQSWSDGKVGMFGHSGSGITQFFVAAQNPPHLNAVIPGAAPVDFYRDIGYPGGLFDYAFMYHWSADAQPSQEARAARIHIDAGDTKCAERIRSRKRENIFEEMLTRPLDSEWYAQRSIYPIASRIRVPTYVIIAWQDQNVDSRAAYVFDKLQGPRKLLLAENGHSFYIRPMEVRREKLRFFDHWLKGVSNGIMDEKPIKVWLTMKGHVEVIPDRVGHYDKLPLADTRWTKYYLGPNHLLTPEPPRQNLSEKYLYPLGTAFVYGGSDFPHTPFGLGSLTFRTRPFEKEMLLLGPTLARLHVASTQTDTSFFLVVNEIKPNGDRKYLQRGYLKASLRELDTGASREWRPVHTFRHPQMLEPNQVTEFTIGMNMTGSVLPAGSLLELQIMAPGVSPEPNGQWGFIPLPMGTNTVHMSPRYPSHILLPIVADE